MTRYTVFQAVADIVGIDAADKLTEALDGQRITVPATCSADHPIVKAVGLENAALISESFQATLLVLPTTNCIDRIVEMHAAKLTIREISLAIGLADHQVRAVLARRLAKDG